MYLISYILLVYIIVSDLRTKLVPKGRLNYAKANLFTVLFKSDFPVGVMYFLFYNNELHNIHAFITYRTL